MRRYQDVLPIAREEAESAFASGSPKAICDALVRVVFHEPDWRWVEAQCLHFSIHPDAEVRGLVATCFGHLARIHGTLDLEKVLPVLKGLLKDPEIAGRAQDALDDIKMFLCRK